MTTVNDILVRVRQRIGDTAKIKYSDEELLDYLNDASSFFSAELIALKDADMIKEFIVASGTTGTALPIDCFSFIGQYPIYKCDSGSGLKVYPFDAADTNNITVKYFAYKPALTAMSDPIAFANPIYHTLLGQLAAIFALNRSNIVAEQDSKLVEQIRAQIRAVKK